MRVPKSLLVSAQATALAGKPAQISQVNVQPTDFGGQAAIEGENLGISRLPRDLR